jgi:NAD(P)-dependent dehydrogenase (short-subunit alcohol dehydrogenase family)
MYQLEGKVAIVTGAGGKQGIGRSIAARLASEGASVAVCDLKDAGTSDWAGLSAVVDEIKCKGVRSVGLIGSVSNSKDVASLVEGTLSEFGKIDILVNNAGAPAGPDILFKINYWDPVWSCWGASIIDQDIDLTEF